MKRMKAFENNEHITVGEYIRREFIDKKGLENHWLEYVLAYSSKFHTYIVEDTIMDDTINAEYINQMIFETVLSVRHITDVIERVAYEIDADINDVEEFVDEYYMTAPFEYNGNSYSFYNGFIYAEATRGSIEECIEIASDILMTEYLG